MADTFFKTTWGPLTGVILIADSLPGAPTDEEVWKSWEDRCLYIGDEEFDPQRQYRAQVVGKNERSFPALHAAHAVQIEGFSVLSVARTYPSDSRQVDERADRNRPDRPKSPSGTRSKTAERLVKRGARMWAEIGAWPWALDDVRDFALVEKLPPTWTWKKASLVHPGHALRGSAKR